MIYELFLEGELADIRHDLGMQLNFNIDDINKYGSRDTSFSKTIILPGTARNNKLLGFVGELGSFNTFARGSANINDNFNPAQTTRAELRANGLLLLKGVFRLTGIVKDKDFLEYEGSLFGELGGFIAAIGNGKLEDLDFSAYNHTYTRDNIVNSWDNIDGNGYYYPLIDYGGYTKSGSTRAKRDYDYRTFRPALFVKEYIDKIFAGSGYTYSSTFLNSDFFKRLIIPNNTKELKGLFTDLLDVKSNRLDVVSDSSANEYIKIIQFNIENLKRSITGNGDPNYTYIGQNGTFIFKYNFSGNVRYNISASNIPFFFYIRLIKNSTIIKQYSIPYSSTANFGDVPFNINDSINVNLNTDDTFYFDIYYSTTVIGAPSNTGRTFITFQSFEVDSNNPILTSVILNDNILIKYSIPRNIFQKDFFTWLIKMFNLYVTEDKLREKHLIIEPYINYYNLNTSIDWVNKVSRDKPWQIKPMGMLNGRIFEYKYKEDSDFYNDNYKKKYNLPYGSNLQDTGFQFAKDKQTIEVGFSPSVLVQYEGRDKIVTAIYKKSSGNAVDQEERMDSNIRILIAKKITGVQTWAICNLNLPLGFENLGALLTSYGYAGHFDDPVNPTVDINFGAASEIYFDPLTYPSNNLFNTYWSGYIAEIADKDSKLLTCYVYLTELDVAQLDFSKPVFIDGVLWRINKVMDFDASSGELTKVELLKVINNG